jgi:Manganese containing catalase
VFVHQKALQFETRPSAPDAVFARRLQEVLGGKWGEMTVAMQYLYQGWNCRLPGKYKDMLMSIGTEELSHVELITTMIGQLLDNAAAFPRRLEVGRLGPGPVRCHQPAAHDRQRSPCVPARQQRDPVVGCVRHGQRQPDGRLLPQRDGRDAGQTAGEPSLPHDR